MTRDELKEYLSKQIDSMHENELLEFSDFLENKSKEELIAEELIVIRGEFKKLTKLVVQMQEQLDAKNIKKTESDLKTFIDFYIFLKNSKNALIDMPENSFFTISKFNRAFGAFENGFLTIDTLYQDILESIELEVSAKIGDKFDSDFHEAVEITKDENIEDGIITEVIEDGFVYQNELLNYGKVKVNRWIS